MPCPTFGMETLNASHTTSMAIGDDEFAEEELLQPDQAEAQLS